MILPDRKLPKALAEAVATAQKKCPKKALENVEIKRGSSFWYFVDGSTSTKGTAIQIAKVLGYWTAGFCNGKKSVKKSSKATNEKPKSDQKLTKFMDQNAHIIQRGLRMGAKNSEREANDPGTPAFVRRIAREDAETYSAIADEIHDLMRGYYSYDEKKPAAKASKKKPGGSGMLF